MCDEKMAEISQLSDEIQILTTKNKEMQESFQQTVDQKQKEINNLKEEKIDLQLELAQRQQENETVNQQLVMQEQYIAFLQEDKENFQQQNQHCSSALEQAQQNLEHQDTPLTISAEDLKIAEDQLCGGACGG